MENDLRAKNGPSRVVPVRLGPDLLGLVDARARRDDATRSGVIRAALQAYVGDGVSTPANHIALSIDDKRRLRGLCEQYGIVRLDLFGSWARGEGGPNSDVDLLYTLGPGVRLGWAIEELAEELAELFGRPVDLVARRALHERLRERVLDEAEVLYAA